MCKCFCYIDNIIQKFTQNSYNHQKLLTKGSYNLNIDFILFSPIIFNISSGLNGANIDFYFLEKILKSLFGSC